MYNTLGCDFMNFLFYICDTLGFLRVMSLIRTILTIIKFLIPIGLIVWIAIDLFKNVINPETKDGVKKIGIRFGAAIVIFLIPTIVSGILKLFDGITGNPNYEASKCYSNATSSCLATINAYVNCEDQVGNEQKECLKFRSCNSYTLDKSCNLTTELDDNNCKEMNESNSLRFYESGFSKK